MPGYYCKRIGETHEQISWSAGDAVWRTVGSIALAATERLRGYDVGATIAFLASEQEVDYGCTLALMPTGSDDLALRWPIYAMRDGDRIEGYAMLNDHEALHWVESQRENGGDSLLMQMAGHLSWFDTQLKANHQQFRVIWNDQWGDRWS